MKKFIALAMSVVFALGLAGCSGDVKTKEQSQAPVSTPAASGDTTSPAPAPAPGKSGEKPAITVATYAANEKIANILRDQLTKNGFEVSVNMQPDYSSYKAIIDAGNYDVSIGGWTTVTGNPDYAVRSLYKSDGDNNDFPINDPKVDELIELAASQTPDEYVSTYKDFELYVVDEMAYTVPLYRNIKTQGVNVELLDPDSIILSKSRSMHWEKMSFNDASKNETDPMVLSQTASNLTSFDTSRGNDGSINMLNSNMYVRVINLTPDDQVTSEGSLSYSHAIAEGNTEYYFALRDDINFAKVENNSAVDSGIRVGGEDVVFSLTRAADKNSVPVHKTYSLHESMEKIEVVTDLAELENTKDASGKTIKELLEVGSPSAITTLSADKTAVDNAGGNYQVVKITTNKPFPQVLNYLAHQSAGILHKETVEGINDGITVENYDVKTDTLYGDQAAVTEGSTYNNTLMASGPYIALVKNDYHILFERNPGYMPTTENFGKMKQIDVKFFKDLESSLAALRSGEIYVLYSVPEEKVELVKSDSKFIVQEMPSNGVTYLGFNLKDGSKMSDINLRQAVKYSVNAEEIKAVYMNRVFDTYTTLTPIVDTGNKLVADPAKAQEYIALYQAEAK